MGDFRSAYFTACNRGKRSVTLDLRNERGRDTFLRLIETADVLITNFQPGTMDGWGLGYEQLSERNPQLVLRGGLGVRPRSVLTRRGRVQTCRLRRAVASSAALAPMATTRLRSR